ncbi:MAG TPA: serine/threonine protein kinase [Chitinispirillaceae bacterium]|nr:serine/threonine protein kinase [Chitinispirillaceae bacterium]
MNFEQLTPDQMLGAAEQATGKLLTGFTAQLPSYINRVYEFQTRDGIRLITKFYRPERWSRNAISDEHTFLQELFEAELPVVPPLTLSNGETIGIHEGIHFAIFPKRAGRQLEINNFEDWLRLGTLVARIHNIGASHPAESRIVLSPDKSTRNDLDYLLNQVIPPNYQNRYRNLVNELIDISTSVFSEIKQIRIHGDLHIGNILDRMDEGLLVIDFDDMAMGPPVQDLWLLLPDRMENSKEEISLFIEGYEQFRDFDSRSLRMIEPLRAMRLIYFLGWCSRQRNDHQFKRNFPNWGIDSFWQKEINDLNEQMGFVRDNLNFHY